MPISQINPNGTVKIYNTKTKQVLDVSPDQLVNYSPKLLTDYNTMVQQNAENQQKLTGKTPVATQKDINMGKSGLRSLQTVADEYQKDPNILAKQLIPGKLLTRKFDSALFNTVDTILRARTGAQANKEEIAAYLNEKGPAFGDSSDVVQYKLNAIQQDLADAAGVKDVKPFAFSKGGSQQGPSVGGFVGNAGQDTKDLLNGVLGMPRNLYDQAAAINQQGGQLPDARGNIGQAAANAATQTGALFNATIAQPLGGLLNEANQVTGRPFEGGDILGRIGQRAYQKPVTTLLDVLPALQGAKALKATGAVGRAGAVTKAVDEAKAVTTAEGSLAQKGLVKAADLSNGGGSKSYLSREAVGKAPAQNKVLLDEGILKHPTDAGKIKAASVKLEDYGTQLRDTYKSSDRVFKDGELGQSLEAGLKEKGWDTKAIDTIKRYINDQGSFDIGNQETLVTPEKAWITAQRLEKNPPKLVGSAENAASLKKLSGDAARILRKKLGEKLPETKPLNERYSAIRDYYDNTLPDQAAPLLDIKGKGVVKGTAAAAQSLLDPILQAGYTGSKIQRDFRYRPGRFVPRK